MYQAKNPFLIGAELHRQTRGGRTTMIWSRHYARVETALRRATELLVLDGEVGDVIEVYNKETGQQIATVRMTARGKCIMDWSKVVQRRTPKDNKRKPFHGMTPVQALQQSLH